MSVSCSNLCMNKLLDKREVIGYAQLQNRKHTIHSYPHGASRPCLSLNSLDKHSQDSEQHTSVSLGSHKRLSSRRRRKGADWRENALSFWDASLVHHKRTQMHLSGLLQRPAAELMMNSIEGLYETQVNIEKLERVLPLVQPGKGYRYQSEFWKQVEYRRAKGAEDLCNTLTRKERGIHEPLIYTKSPDTILKEKGISPNRKELGRTPSVRNQQMTYTEAKRRALAPLLKSMFPYEPEMEHLEIIGRSIEHQDVSEDTNHESEAVADPELCESEVTSVGELGPVLTIGGQEIQWFPDSVSVDDVSPVQIYMTFEQQSEPDPFDSNRSRCANFYLNSLSGHLLPGESSHIRIHFRALRAGIYQETWRLQTEPVLNAGRYIQLNLHGISVWSDDYRWKIFGLEPDCTEEIERNALNRVISDWLIENITTFESPRCPVVHLKFVPSERSLFETLNPSFFYRYDTVQQLKSIYEKVRCTTDFSRLPEQWNLSLDKLRETLYSWSHNDNDIDTVVLHDNLLNEFFQAVDKLCCAPITVSTSDSSERFLILNEMLIQTALGLFVICDNLRLLHGLPELTIPTFPESEGSYESATPRSSLKSELLQEEISSGLSVMDGIERLESFSIPTRAIEWRRKAYPLVYHGLHTMLTNVLDAWFEIE